MYINRVLYCSIPYKKNYCLPLYLLYCLLFKLVIVLLFKLVRAAYSYCIAACQNICSSLLEQPIHIVLLFKLVIVLLFKLDRTAYLYCIAVQACQDMDDYTWDMLGKKILHGYRKGEGKLMCVTALKVWYHLCNNQDKTLCQEMKNSHKLSHKWDMHSHDKLEHKMCRNDNQRKTA